MFHLSTGRVPSPTLNELPTAEDVEAMIESMRAGETSLPTDNGEEQPSQGSAPPSVAPMPGTVESSPSQPPLPPQGTAVNGMEGLSHLNQVVCKWNSSHKFS